jgi:hypothetical protein
LGAGENDKPALVLPTPPCSSLLFDTGCNCSQADMTVIGTTPNQSCPCRSGLLATFQFGGLKRSDTACKISVRQADVAVRDGPAPLYYHGVAELKEGKHRRLVACASTLPSAGRCNHGKQNGV